MQEIAEKEAIILAEMLRPERCLQFLRPGRLIRVRDGQVDWGWGVLVSVVRATPKAALGVLPPPRDAALPAKEDPDAHAEAYVLDTLLICAKGSGQGEGHLLGIDSSAFYSRCSLLPWQDVWGWKGFSTSNTFS